MNLGDITLEGILDGHDRLDEKRLSVSKVQMHDPHHGNSHEGGFDCTLQLRRIVVLNCRRNERGLLLRKWLWRVDVL